MRETTAIEFERMFRELYPRLYYYALDLIGDEEDAKDAVSGVFTNIWTKHRDIDMQKLSPYLYSSVRNKCIDLLKLQHRVKMVPDAILLNQEFDDESWLEREEKVKIVERKIELLPELQRKLLVMHYLNGMTYKEIAVALDMRYDAVKKQIYRIMKQLRKDIREKIQYFRVLILSFLSPFI